MIHNINNLLEKVGNDNEAVRWIRKFSSVSGIFAVIKIGGDSFAYSDSICEDLGILSKLDLITPVVYGWGNALTKKLEQNGISTIKHEKTGLRVTKKEDLPYLEEIANEQGSILVEGLKKRNISSEIVYGVFSAVIKEFDDVTIEHYTGEFVGVSVPKIMNYLNKGVIPIIPPLGYTIEGQLLNINADSAAKGLVLSLNPKRYIMATNSGGVLDNKNKIISELSIEKDYQKLIQEEIISGGMKIKVDEAKDTIEKSRNLEIQIAHPNNILAELFTDKGKGTYITK